jgi:ABC-type glycerol-3-phosphate transport system substrate-binding protein
VVTLTLWVPSDLSPFDEDGGGSTLAQHLADFRDAYPDLQVETIVKKARGRGGLLDFLRTAHVAAPSVLPDLVVLDVDDLRLATQGGLLQPIDGLLPEEVTRDRFSFASQMGQVGEQTMGVAIAAELQHLAYNPALLTSPPVSWTAVISAPEAFVFPAAGQEGNVNDATLVQYLAAGGRVLDEEGMPVLEEEPLRDVLAFYEGAVATGVISPTVVLSMDDTEDAWTALQSGQAGMAVVDSRTFQQTVDHLMRLAPIPTQDGRPASMAKGWVVAMVSSDPERQQLAARLLEWLLAPQFVGLWTYSEGYLPTTSSGLRAWSVSEEERAELETLLEGAVPPVTTSTRVAVGPAMQAALEAVLQGRRTPASAAAEAARAAKP